MNGRSREAVMKGKPKRRMISKRRDCRLMKRTTELHGGVYHRTSTTHKSENKMKMKKKTAYILVSRCWQTEPLCPPRSHRRWP